MFMRRRNDDRDKFLGQAGWLFADVLLGLAMYYFAIGTTVTYSDGTTPMASPTVTSAVTAFPSPTLPPSSSPTPQSSPTPVLSCQDVLSGNPISFTLFENDSRGRKEKLLAGDPSTELDLATTFRQGLHSALESMGVDRQEIESSRVGFVIIDGNSTGQDGRPGAAYSRAAFKAISKWDPSASRALSQPEGTFWVDSDARQSDRLKVTVFRFQRECISIQ